jgi:hypothetical protein
MLGCGVEPSHTAAPTAETSSQSAPEVPPEEEKSEATEPAAPVKQPTKPRAFLETDIVVFSLAEIIATIDASDLTKYRVYEKSEFSEKQLKAFQLLHGIVTTQCQSCHVSLVGFAHENPSNSLQAILEKKLIQEEDSASSKLAVRMADGHNNLSPTTLEQAAMLEAIDHYWLNSK